ncbi:MAG TPA: hypothetical protein VGN57_01415 [Pirellulaceae bacterium]|jgi:hypothetical protein|nr:hypothetical protein [Pirellulaceae bacterium]
MPRKIRALGATVLLLVATASATNVDAVEPVPASRPAAWWDPLGLFQEDAAPAVRRKGEWVGSEYEFPTFEGPAYRSSVYHEGRGPGIPIDYSFDHIVDQP